MVEPQTERSRALVDTALSSRRIAHWLFAHRAEPTSRTCAVNSCCRAFRIPLSASPVLTKAWSKQNSSVPRPELAGRSRTSARSPGSGRTGARPSAPDRPRPPQLQNRTDRGCSWSAALQGKRVPLTARPALQVFSAPSVSPYGGHRYTRAAGLAAAAREASPRGGHVFRGDSCTGGRP